MPPFLSRIFLLSLNVNLVFCSYYCTNPGYPCLNGATCMYNGECKCTSGFRGFNCGLDSNTLAAKCTVECHNKGICHNGNECYCTKDYMGPTCQQAYDYAECGTTNVKIKAYRPKEFNGEIFLIDSMFNCKLQEVNSTIAGYKQYELNVSHASTGPCKLHRTVDTTTGDVHFAVNVSTVHKKGQFGMYDGLKTVSCHYSSREQAVVTDVTNHDGVVTLTMEDSNGNAVTELPPHDNLFLKFEGVNLPAGFRRMKVVDLEVYVVAEQWGDIISVPLIKDDCVTQKAEALGFSISQQEQRRSRIRIPMKAVPIFENLQGPYYFNYRLKLCTTRSRCQPSQNCPSWSSKPLPKGEIFKHKPRGLRIN
nr:P-U12 [Pinctada fucata]